MTYHDIPPEIGLLEPKKIHWTRHLWVQSRGPGAWDGGMEFGDPTTQRKMDEIWKVIRNLLIFPFFPMTFHMKWIWSYADMQYIHAIPCASDRWFPIETMWMPDCHVRVSRGQTHDDTGVTGETYPRNELRSSKSQVCGPKSARIGRIWRSDDSKKTNLGKLYSKY